MKCLVLLSLLATVAHGYQILDMESMTAFDYYARFGFPQAEKIRGFEESVQRDRVAGGHPSASGQFPWQAGLLSEISGFQGTGICGASLLTSNRLLTAAHCWWDGVHQATRLTVVLGSVTLFTGGTRVLTTRVVVHPDWDPRLIRNDIAVIYLSSDVAFSANVQPIRLQYDSGEDLTGRQALTSGFGLTMDMQQNSATDVVSAHQNMHHVAIIIISNAECRSAYPGLVRDSNVCTDGELGNSVCSGDSGGPLVIYYEHEPRIVGLTSFGSSVGCTVGLPSVFTRVSSYIDFIEQHL